MSMTDPRSEHLEWCKTRALAYVDAGDLPNAMASMTSDLRKHPDTEDHPGIELGMLLMLSRHLTTGHDMREWIQGFN